MSISLSYGTHSNGLERKSLGLERPTTLRNSGQAVGGRYDLAVEGLNPIPHPLKTKPQRVRHPAAGGAGLAGLKPSAYKGCADAKPAARGCGAGARQCCAPTEKSIARITDEELGDQGN